MDAITKLLTNNRTRSAPLGSAIISRCRRSKGRSKLRRHASRGWLAGMVVKAVDNNGSSAIPHN